MRESQSQDRRRPGPHPGSELTGGRLVGPGWELRVRVTGDFLNAAYRTTSGESDLTGLGCSHRHENLEISQ